mmetsp:Transcript_10096/g.19488  ORF Transcript_10096/g.19488 Transcript_10096/m.19488 type:complete len:99 (+) Transcript_10096:1512-1808(+)
MELFASISTSQWMAATWATSRPFWRSSARSRTTRSRIARSAAGAVWVPEHDVEAGKRYRRETSQYCVRGRRRLWLRRCNACVSSRAVRVSTLKVAVQQ